MEAELSEKYVEDLVKFVEENTSILNLQEHLEELKLSKLENYLEYISSATSD